MLTNNFNTEPASGVVVVRSGLLKPRYSGFDSNIFQELPASDDVTELPANYYNSSTSTGSSFNWGSFLSNLINTGGSVATAIWGKDQSNQNAALSTLYQQEKRTNVILWVVIGLVVLLALFLVIKKSK